MANFFSVSSPSDTFEAEPASIVGLCNPLQRLNYRIRSLTSTELLSHPPFSSLVTTVINTNGDVKDLSNTQPLLDHEFNQNITPSQSITDISFEEDIRSDVVRYLSMSPDQLKYASDPSTESNNNLEMNIHSLAKNESQVLDVQATDESMPSIQPRTDPMGASDFMTPAESALRTEVVDVSKVFDLSDQQDLDLFGLSKNSGISDDDDDDDEHDGGTESNKDTLADAMFEKLKIHSDGPDSQLDDELDTIIGESYGIHGDLRTFKKKKARLAKSKVHSDDIVWASEDTTDISDFSQLVPDMAIDYPFNLDVFQKRAVHRLERDENVFVAAHTSAGKTVVAEYAIALALQRNTKVIYTSPIKTLSNQKFRDFTQRFGGQAIGDADGQKLGDVGIITGDISINPEASCLIMTTEILRSMLYKGADLIRDLSHVIFDECHWLNDPERGVVWEESIIMLPRSVTIVMLSATVPNAMEFAKWVGTTKEKPVYVVHTPKRPVPLSHQLFLKGEAYKLFDSSQSRFLDVSYRRAAAAYKEGTKNASARQGMGRHHTWMPIIKYLRKRSLDPAIFFCFSKKKCDDAADQLNTQDLTSGASDKSHIHQFYQSAISRLSPADRNVPQITRHREMLKRGIGLHHAGLLPIIKEITEVLFQSGYIRILFATETFAMGVNMPARTVVFTAIHKFDSQSFRLLEPGEYVQMAGRAGRRGLDDVGTVLLYPNAVDFPSESDVKAVLTGMPKPLRSQFRLTYNMILNLLRIDELRVEDVMARSFSEAPAGRTSSTVKKLLEKGNETLSGLQDEGRDTRQFEELFNMSVMVEQLSKTIGKEILDGKNSALGVLNGGRVVILRAHDRTVRVGVIVKGLSTSSSKKMPSLKPLKSGLSGSLSVKSGQGMLKVVTLLGGPALAGLKSPLCASIVTDKNLVAERKQYNCNGIIIEVGNVSLDSIDTISLLKVPLNERELNPIRGEPNIAALSAVADELRRIASDESNWGAFPSAHAIRDLGFQSLDTEALWNQRCWAMQSIIDTLRSFVVTGAIADMASTFTRLSKSSLLENKLQKLRDATSDETLQLMPEYRQRILVLERLGYIDGTTVRLKGRAACEVNTCESIILSELVYEQVLQPLEAADLAAVLSALVFTERLEEGVAPGMEELQLEAPQVVQTCVRMTAVLESVGNVLAEYDVGESGKEYVRSHVRLGFVKGVRDWAHGKSFVEVCGVYDGAVPEGTIVRTIVRLCELLRELKNVGRVIGDPALQTRAQEAVDLCRRDVIFAASLYVS